MTNDMPTTRESLFNKIAFLRRQRNELLVPFIRKDIPEDVLSVMSVYPKYFKSSCDVEITDGTRSIVSSVSLSFPTEGDRIKVSVPACVLDEVISVNNYIEDILNRAKKIESIKLLSLTFKF